MSSSMAGSPLLPAQPPQPLEDGRRPPALHIQPRPSGRPPGSVADPDPPDPDPNPKPDPDPRVLGPPGSGSGSISQRDGSGSGSGSSIIKQK
jgi:hypothetical protein